LNRCIAKLSVKMNFPTLVVTLSLQANKAMAQYMKKARIIFINKSSNWICHEDNFRCI